MLSEISMEYSKSLICTITKAKTQALEAISMIMLGPRKEAMKTEILVKEKAKDDPKMMQMAEITNASSVTKRILAIPLSIPT